MKIINLEIELSLDGLALVYHHLKDKKAEEGDLIQKDKNNLGVILHKGDYSFYLGSFNEKEDILVTAFNPSSYAQFYSVKGTGSYPKYKNIIETTFKEAVK